MEDMGASCSRSVPPQVVLYHQLPVHYNPLQFLLKKITILLLFEKRNSNNSLDCASFSLRHSLSGLDIVQQVISCVVFMKVMEAGSIRVDTTTAQFTQKISMMMHMSCHELNKQVLEITFSYFT